MKNYQNQADKIAAMAKAHKEIVHFLKCTSSYAELMALAAKAQRQIFSLIDLVDQDDMCEVHIEDINDFFYFAFRAFDLLVPFSEDNIYAQPHLDDDVK